MTFSSYRLIIERIPTDITDNIVHQTLVPTRRTYQRFVVILIEYLLSITLPEPTVAFPTTLYQ